MLSKNIRFIIFITLLLFANNTISAHCDSMEAPVVKASQKALETGNLNYALVWIKPEYEPQVRTLFEKVKEVRSLGDNAKELADNYFFETVVRLHRMGEGEPYTGLKPVGYNPGKGIETADLAIETNSIESVLSLLDPKYHTEVTSSFNDVLSKKNYEVDDVKAGREYVTSYVHFIHQVADLSGEGEHEE